MFGEFDSEDDDPFFMSMLFLISSVLQALVMMNLLIAIVGKTNTNVRSQESVR
jgi:hypothetical protein